MADEKHGKTLFVRNLPYSATNDALEKIFSEIGPIKSCFVVKDRDSGKCRGFGYVKFTLLEDAEKALKTVKKVDGRPVHIIYANKKEKKKRFGKPVETTYDENTTEDNAAAKDKPQSVSIDKKTSKKQSKSTATPVKGQKQAPNPLNEGKRARLIVRNLAFRCTKEDLKTAFEPCGIVTDVHIPKKESGTRLGFGFVQFSNKTQAGMAVREMNGKAVCGRVVAVDWALPKDKFETKLAVSAVKDDPKAVADESMEVNENEEDEEEEEKNSDSEGENESSSEDDDGEGDNDSESDSEDDSDDGENTDSSSDDEEDDSGIEEGALEKRLPQVADRESDVNEGRTVFIRNLPYTADNDELQEFFSQFGNVIYARVVMDRNSGMPKGSAFVQFQSKEDASSSIEAASSEGGLSLGGRQLVLSIAVNRQQAGDLVHQKEKKKEQKDSRNLYLAREGMIRPGTEAAKDVPQADLTRRAKIDASKRKKLKDQNVFVSSTRLCLHNIPPTVTDQKLRAIVLKAVGDKSAKIVECRIMRDLNRVNSQGVGKSRGYAFCAFSQHEHALAALKILNNNPEIFGDKKRPIVEFSLENRKALEAKQKRLEKSKIKQVQNRKNPEAQHSGTVNAKKKRQKKLKDSNPLERKQVEDKKARSLHKGPLGLPSHSGAKQRHKPRPGQQGKARDGNKKNFQKLQTRQHQPVKKPRERPVKQPSSNKKRKDFDNFDKLVAAYKQKIMSSAKF